ncbi:hypothetical protein EYF80_051310 [Liparis tanakae]|uniref:Uncharacterized protein n=1 Tax=Liparis tanakae TaxID=230148 RepID=A0A4Z2FBG9_9TELE|nr:hypothetical protein EYF80_051310 [Liparis tanakae]
MLSFLLDRLLSRCRSTGPLHKSGCGGDASAAERLPPEEGRGSRRFLSNPSRSEGSGRRSEA